MSLRIGSLFAGYGGLDMAVMEVLDAQIAWYAEYDPAPAKVMAHHYSHVPNRGDVTRIDWATVEPVDILTGGVPCQDVSHAGKRAGMRAGTRTGLWSAMRDAINALRPPLVIFENVRGILSADADSDLEPCPGCVGDPDDGAVLRALGRVLGDLADLGYDTRWYGLRAADVGAAHNRFRVFVFAAPADTGREYGRQGTSLTRDLTLLRTPTAQLAVNGGSQHPEKRCAGGHGPILADETEYLLPTPCASDRGKTRDLDHRIASGSQLELSDVVRMLPTPAVNDMGAGKTVEQWDAWTEKMQAKHGNGNGHGPSLAIEMLRLLPTPTAMDSKASGGKVGGPDVTLTDATARAARPWAQYESAIRRHEHALGRPAPAPTEPGRTGPRLSPAFVEWLMMLPAGHVTDPAIGLTMNDQLRMLGNGVVPAQAGAALRTYIRDEQDHCVLTETGERR